MLYFYGQKNPICQAEHPENTTIQNMLNVPLLE